VVRGVRAVSKGALTFSRLAESARLALVNGAPGIVAWLPNGQPMEVMGFTVTRGKIVEIDILADHARLRQLHLAMLEGRRSSTTAHRSGPGWNGRCTDLLRSFFVQVSFEKALDRRIR
jgi:hypothetical protein